MYITSDQKYHVFGIICCMLLVAMLIIILTVYRQIHTFEYWINHWFGVCCAGSSDIGRPICIARNKERSKQSYINLLPSVFNVLSICLSGFK